MRTDGRERSEERGVREAKRGGKGTGWKKSVNSGNKGDETREGMEELCLSELMEMNKLRRSAYSLSSITPSEIICVMVFTCFSKLPATSR